MKKAINFVGALLVGGVAFTAGAQQLPNVGFESWKGTGNCGKTTWTSTMKTDGGFTRPGDEPTDWCGSSVKPFNSSITSSVRCAKVTADGNTYAKVDNADVLGNIIPGYMTVAQPWVFVGGTGWSNAARYASGGDGGSHNSVAFAFRPDALTLRYQKTGSETSHIIAMLWNGTFKSYVPSSCDTNGNQTFGTELEDVDRVVIGRQDDDKVSQKGTLVASLDKEITSEVTTWTTAVLPLEYKTTDVTPSKMNVVLAASDYWTRANLKGGTSLLVDDVDFVYYSTLSALKAGSKTVTLADNVYSYNVDGKMPAKDEVAATCKSQFATADVTVDSESYKITVKVTNQGGKDLDGLTEHTYTLQYTAPAEQTYNGVLNVEMVGSTLLANVDKAVTIKYYNDGTCDFVLPNFSCLGISLGDIAVPNVKVTEDEAGNKTFTDGEVKEMSLAGGAIVAHVVLNGGTIAADGTINMPITVGWMMGYPDNKAETPISVLFSSEEKAALTVEGYYSVVKGTDYQHRLSVNVPTVLKVVKKGEGEFTYNVSLDDVKGEGVNFGNMTLKGISYDTEGRTFSGTDAAVALPDGTIASVTVSGGRDQSEADSKTYNVNFATTVGTQLYNIEFYTQEVPTGVADVAAKTVAGVKYVSLTGVESATPFEGVNIVVTTYTDGSKKTAKVVK